MQNTNQLLMIRPVRFGYNAQTAVNNAFQVAQEQDTVQQRALAEFDNFVKILQDHGVNVLTIDDTPEPHTPDSIFPNNWISFHSGNTICLYPMFAENRRKERNPQTIEMIKEKFSIKEVIDFSHYESENLFLEGTGSMVLDRKNKITYACLSPRTDTKVLDDFCQQMGYKPVCFTATDKNGGQIYHTNVMMCIADKYAVICLDTIRDKDEKQLVIDALDNSGKAIIEINMDQMNQFAGNMLQVENNQKEKLLVMSDNAYNSLNADQIKKLESFNHIVHASLNTIETNGGGSARCMMAEIF